MGLRSHKVLSVTSYTARKRLFSGAACGFKAALKGLNERHRNGSFSVPKDSKTFFDIFVYPSEKNLFIVSVRK